MPNTNQLTKLHVAILGLCAISIVLLSVLFIISFLVEVSDISKERGILLTGIGLHLVYAITSVWIGRFVKAQRVFIVVFLVLTTIMWMGAAWHELLPKVMQELRVPQASGHSSYVLRIIFDGVPKFVVPVVALLYIAFRRQAVGLSEACPTCGYSLQGLRRPVCPECGAAVNTPHIRNRPQDR